MNLPPVPFPKYREDISAYPLIKKTAKSTTVQLGPALGDGVVVTKPPQAVPVVPIPPVQPPVVPPGQSFLRIWVQGFAGKREPWERPSLNADWSKTKYFDPVLWAGAPTYPIESLP